MTHRQQQQQVPQMAMPQPLIPVRPLMAVHLQNQLLTNTRLNQAQREHILQTTSLHNSFVAAGTQLPPEAEYILNKQMAFQVGNTMGGWGHGKHIANAMDSQMMGIPPPPAPTGRYRGYK